MTTVAAAAGAPRGSGVDTRNEAPRAHERRQLRRLRRGDGRSTWERRGHPCVLRAWLVPGSPRGCVVVGDACSPDTPRDRCCSFAAGSSRHRAPRRPRRARRRPDLGCRVRVGRPELRRPTSASDVRGWALGSGAGRIRIASATAKPPLRRRAQRVAFRQRARAEQRAGQHFVLLRRPPSLGHARMSVVTKAAAYAAHLCRTSNGRSSSSTLFLVVQASRYG